MLERVPFMSEPKRGNTDPGKKAGAASIKPWGLAVRAIIRDGKKRVLLIRRSAQCGHFAGQWEFPGGKVDAGETIDGALCREVGEETGLKVSPTGVAGATAFEMAKVHVVLVYFDVVLRGGKVRLSAEHDGFAWVEPAKIRKLDLSPQIQTFLRRHAVN